MGTDIHIFAEEKVDGEWRPILPPYEKKYSRGSASLYWANWWTEEGRDKPDPTARHYKFFALLANVRNGYGFAGVPTHKPVEPQYPGRGIPKDTSYTEESGVWLGDHSFTWATLRELLAMPWELEFDTVGIVGPEGFEQWRTKGMPDTWSGGISGPNIKVYEDPEEYGRLLDAGELRIETLGEGKNQMIISDDFCRVAWTWKPLENAPFRRWLNEFAEGRDLDNTRLIFGFDS